MPPNRVFAGSKKYGDGGDVSPRSPPILSPITWLLSDEDRKETRRRGRRTRRIVGFFSARLSAFCSESRRSPYWIKFSDFKGH
jgi:hypothetical protein